jgi:hypothetical protein
MANSFVTLAFALLGLVFALLGVPLARGEVPPNRWYGFRTAKTLSDPSIWYAANRAQGIDLCIGGIVAAVAAAAVYLLWRAAPPQRLALADAGILVAVLAAATVHGFVVLARL